MGEPLGVAKSAAGRWQIAPGKSEITALIRESVGEETTYAALEAGLAKSRLGLRPEQTAVALCALLRDGTLAAFDAQNQELAPASIGLPLRRALHRVRPGRLPGGPEWAKIAVLTRELCGVKIGAPGFVEAGRVAGLLLAWRENAAQNGDLARARAAQLRRALGHAASAWHNFDEAGQAPGAVLEAIPPRGAPFEVLSSAARLDFETHRAGLSRFHKFEDALGERTAPLLALHALLQHPDLVAPPDLQDGRVELLERVGAGENALFDADLLADGQNWSQNYALQYGTWHAAQNEAARWNSLRRVAQSEAARVLERFSTLQNRAFGGDFASQIEVELAKRCARESALSFGEAVCASCGLRLGERVLLRDAADFERALEAELRDFGRALAQSGPRDYLERHGSPFGAWNGDSTTLLPLLSSANLRLLDEAFAPRRRVTRSGAALLEALQTGATRAQIEAAFTLWLDGGEGLAPDDEVEIGE